MGGIYRKVAKLFRYRPISYPYISGDGFRSFADHVYDEIKTCKACDVMDGDIVFLVTHKIKEWFADIHPNINAKYVLITHNSDAIVGEEEIKNIDDKIDKWFAQNNTTSHKKVIPIPIGIENKKIFSGGWVMLKVIKRLTRERIHQRNRILFGFSITTNLKERTVATESLRKTLVADELISRAGQYKYLKTLIKYKFVASPEGNGPDCIRIWESLIFNVVPIIRNISNSQILIQNNLPVMLIDSWKNVESLTEEKLSDIYSKYNFSQISDIISYDYWKNIIVKK